MARKFNLVVQDTYHQVDSDSDIQLSPYNLGTMTVADSYHELKSVQYAHTAAEIKLNTTDLLVEDSWHDHPVDMCHPYMFKYNLSGLDSYHVLIDPECEPSLHFHGDLGDGLTPNYLPALELYGQTGHRGTMGIDDELPAMECEAYSGATVDPDLYLPDLELDATMLPGGFGTLDSYLSFMQFQGNSGHRLDNLFLPGLQLLAVATGGLIGTLDATLPGLTLDAVLEPPITGSLDRDLPPLRLSAHCGVDGILNLDATLPTLKSTSAMAVGATLDALLPALLMDEAEGISGDVLTLTATLPTLVVRPIGTGGEEGGADPPLLVDESRFTDYVLRYAR